MEISSLALILLSFTIAWGAWWILKWAWLTPKKLERLLRQQGLNGNPYKLLIGDLKERSMMHADAESRPIGLLDDIVPRVEPLLHRSIHKHGKTSFMWFGTIPIVIITNPDQIKEVFLKISDFQKPHMFPALKMIVNGLVDYEGEKWASQRKVMTYAFHMEKIKLMLPTFYSCCDEMFTRWEKLASTDGQLEIDAWPELEKLTRDMTTRAAFGRSDIEEGKRVFQLLQELFPLVREAVYALSIPGWRFLPTKKNRRMNKLNQEVESLVRRIISKRERAMETSGEPANDLLGYLLESNMKVNQENNRGNKYETMSTKDLIIECKQFHFAGQLPILLVLAWTMVLLGIHPEWQNNAREEVLQVFGTKKPDFDALGKLKIVTMILYEVMRLYPPIPTPYRAVSKDTKLGKLTIPAGVLLVAPTLLVHHDKELWGHDANEFKPERFSEGLSKATNNQVSYFPFSWGPRMCIGQNLALLQAKMGIAMILQRFWFELSPSYAHAPMSAFFLQPQHGVQLVLHKL